MRQIAPFPDALAELVEQLHYRTGWRFSLEDIDRGQGSEGLTLVINAQVLNSYATAGFISILHYMLVPPAAYDVRSWQHWLLEQLLLVERHECMEFMRFIDSASYPSEYRPYAPSHGPGNDPYLIREVGTETDQRTSFRGEVKAA